MADTAAAGDIRDVDFADALGERYLVLCAVHDHVALAARCARRAEAGAPPHPLRDAASSGSIPASGYKKCARVVGDVIGKFHPHGDSAVYDALVRLAQDFAQRYPLVDGQGNFGNIDGDNAAAMRYTESRLTGGGAGAARRHRRGRGRFPRRPMTARTSEPVVLPAAFPNLLANGAAGIAVGMATSIPPHNAGELCAALLHLIENPACADRRAASRMLPGPDFPTGGVLVEPPESIARGLCNRAAAASACARAGRRRSWRTASTRSSSPRSPIRCRKAG